MKITFEYWLKKYCMLLEIVKGNLKVTLYEDIDETTGKFVDEVSFKYKKDNKWDTLKNMQDFFKRNDIELDTVEVEYVCKDMLNISRVKVL